MSINSSGPCGFVGAADRRRLVGRPQPHPAPEAGALAGCCRERRIAIVATYHFIRQGELADTFAIADMLLADKHGLIHKAVGWMLKGSRQARSSKPRNDASLALRHARMPRTMLRYTRSRSSQRACAWKFSHSRAWAARSRARPTHTQRDPGLTAGVRGPERASTDAGRSAARERRRAPLPGRQRACLPKTRWNLQSKRFIVSVGTRRSSSSRMPDAVD